jgi:hypothetical protein
MTARRGMLGLLAKAKQIRGDQEEIVFDPDSGISREDQKEILKEIDKVATRNRMAVSSEAFEVRAVKRGVLFPVVVILSAVVAMGTGLGAFYLLFQRGESQLAGEQSSSITAEGKLIAEVQKESAARIQEKNQQINQIQGRLAEIDQQRKDLQSNMDAKVSQREQELRTALARELDAEKERLQKQGLSDQAIARKLQDLEAQKNAEATRQLDSYRRQADAERQQAEQNLKGLEAEYKANLEKANAERQQVLTDSRKREEELKSQLEQRTRSLETEKAQAEQALKTIASQREKEDLVQGQLIGLYAVAKSDISQQSYDKALQSLKAVADYVNRQDVAVLPGIAKRRDFDLFVVDSLTSLVQGEIDKGRTDTASLLASANQLTEVRNRVSDAEGHLLAGRPADAEKAFDQALQVIPEISRSYGYFINRDRDADAARQARLRGELSRAEAAFDAGKYADAVSTYRQAFAYLPETPERVDRALTNIAAAGLDAGAQKSRQDQAKAAASVLAQAKALAAQNRPDDALPLYYQILARYPQSPQAEPAAQGVQGAVKALNDRAAADRARAEADLNAQIAALKQELAARRADVSGIKRNISALIGGTADPDGVETDALLASLREKYTALAAEKDGIQKSTEADRSAGAAERRKLTDDLAKASDQNQKLIAQLDGMRADLEKARQQATQQQTAGTGSMNPADAQKLKELEETVAALGQAYKSYTGREDPVLAQKGDRGLVDTKAYLDTFLGSKAVQGTFPGLLGRIHKYDRGFQSAGRTDALSDALDVVIDLSRQSAPDKRKKILDDQMKSFRKDPDMTTFLKELQGLLK